MVLDDQELMTIAHELAHNIDFKAMPSRSMDGFNSRKWGINDVKPYYTPEAPSKIEDQLLWIYRALNNPAAK